MCSWSSVRLTQALHTGHKSKEAACTEHSKAGAESRTETNPVQKCLQATLTGATQHLQCCDLTACPTLVSPGSWLSLRRLASWLAALLSTSKAFMSAPT